MTIHAKTSEDEDGADALALDSTSAKKHMYTEIRQDGGRGHSGSVCKLCVPMVF